MRFLKNCWYVAGFPEEAGAKPFARTYLDEPVLIFRTEAGEVVAMDNRCPHRLASLDMGLRQGDVIQCRYHGLRFNAQGVCLGTPHTTDAPPRARLRVYPVVERHQILWIWMGDPELADPALIPDFSHLDHDQCGWFNGYIYVRGNYQLVVDNLLDLSHAEYLHPLLASEGWQTRNVQKIEQKGDSLYVTNIAHNDPMLPMLRRLRPDINPVGTWIQEERWDAPGVLVLNFEFESEGKKIVLPNGHFLTPETSTTTHYMIRSGHYENKDSPEFTAAYKAGVIAIFEQEDVPVIEAQQRNIGDIDLMEVEPAILKDDSAAIRARRLLAKKIRLEQAAQQPLAAAQA